MNGISLLAAAASLASSVLAADDPPTDGILAEAYEVAAAIALEQIGPDGGPAELIERPVLRYGDAARDNERGTAWLWTRGGRPVALMEMYFNTQTGARIQVVTSLAESPLAAHGDGFNWRPETRGVEFRPLDGPAPAEAADARLRQMKALARRFRAHEFWDPDHSRYELRLLPQPVHRYSAPEAGIEDGTIFLLAHDTNPEIALLIEAERSPNGIGWRTAAARIGHAEIHLELDRADVWQTERVDVTTPDEPYHLFYHNPPVP